VESLTDSATTEREDRRLEGQRDFCRENKALTADKELAEVFGRMELSYRERLFTLKEILNG